MCSPACVFARYLMGVAFCWLRLCFWTDVDGVHSAYYSDDTCATLVPASTDTWNDAPMDQCTQHNEYTLEPSCVDTLPPSLAELSSFSGYMDDDTCSTPAQAISTQYFVTNQCFTIGDGSRENFCSEEAAEIVNYSNDNCDKSGELPNFRQPD